MKWDVKHDRAKKVLNHFLDNAGYWTETESLTEGLTEEEIQEVSAEVATMIQSITKRYKLDVVLPAEPVVKEEPAAEEKAEEPVTEEPAEEVKEEKPAEKPKPRRVGSIAATMIAASTAPIASQAWFHASGLTPSALELVDRTCLQAVDDWKNMGLSVDANVVLLGRTDAPAGSGLVAVHRRNGADCADTDGCVAMGGRVLRPHAQAVAFLLTRCNRHFHCLPDGLVHA